jgi:hypothetical protein
MALASNPINAGLTYIIGMVRKSQSSFSTMSIFYILRENNKEAD